MTKFNFKSSRQIIREIIGFPKNYKCIHALWQYGLWSFQTGDTKFEIFLPKNQHTQRKFLNFENWTNGKPQ